MDNWNKTELRHHLIRLRCLDAENAENPLCKKILDLLMQKDARNPEFNQSGAVRNDVKSVASHFLIASYSLAIFLNFALLWLMYKDPLKKFRTPSSLLIVNLAVSDFFGACFSLVIDIETQISSNNRYDTSELTTLYLPWLVLTAVQSSYYSVILVCCDRYAAIAYPFRYRVLFVTKYTLLAMLISWLLSFAISSPLYFTHELYKKTTAGSKFYATNTFVLIAIILILCPLTHSSLRRQRKRLLTMNASNTELLTKKLKIEKSFANTTFLVCFTFIFFTSPYVVVFFFTAANCNSCILNKYFLHIWTYFRIFFALHFGVNPVIYALRLPCYKQSFLNLIFSIFKNRRAGRGHNGPIQMTSGKMLCKGRQNAGAVLHESSSQTKTV